MKSKKDKKKLPDLAKTDILRPLTINEIGSNGDPCFGKHYDLTTKECKLCGDSELCAIVFAQSLNKTREELEKENHFKDMDVLIDVPGIKKYMRGLKRRDKTKKEIIQGCVTRFAISLDDARSIYKQLKS